MGLVCHLISQLVVCRADNPKDHSYRTECCHYTLILCTTHVLDKAETAHAEL